MGLLGDAPPSMVNPVPPIHAMAAAAASRALMHQKSTQLPTPQLPTPQLPNPQMPHMAPQMGQMVPHITPPPLQQQQPPPAQPPLKSVSSQPIQRIPLPKQNKNQLNGQFRKLKESQVRSLLWRIEIMLH